MNSKIQSKGGEINAKPEVANSFPRCESGKRGGPQRRVFQAKLAGTLRWESRISTRNQMLSKKIEGAWCSAA